MSPTSSAGFFLFHIIPGGGYEIRLNFLSDGSYKHLASESTGKRDKGRLPVAFSSLMLASMRGMPVWPSFHLWKSCSSGFHLFFCPVVPPSKKILLPCLSVKNLHDDTLSICLQADSDSEICIMLCFID